MGAWGSIRSICFSRRKRTALAPLTRRPGGPPARPVERDLEGPARQKRRPAASPICPFRSSGTSESAGAFAPLPAQEPRRSPATIIRGPFQKERRKRGDVGTESVRIVPELAERRRTADVSVPSRENKGPPHPRPSGETHTEAKAKEGRRSGRLMARVPVESTRSRGKQRVRRRQLFPQSRALTYLSYTCHSAPEGAAVRCSAPVPQVSCGGINERPRRGQKRSASQGSSTERASPTW
ncbi:hypothetical protein GN956_G15151 [Arapaima gigas]